MTQIVAIDRLALEDRIGELPDWLITQIDGGPARALALARP